MKLRNFLITFIFLLLTFSLISCDTTDPGNPPEVRPPGYQEDIPWPSLADSPSPMVHVTPQSTNRIKESFPTTFRVNWLIDTLDLTGGIVADNNNTIYFPSRPYLYAVGLDGEIKWKLNLGFDSNTTPIITKSGNIITYFHSPSKITSVSPDGEINWELKLNFNIVSQLNIGKLGEIYFTADNTFYTVKDNEIVASIHDIRIGNQFSISPDGNYAYIVNFSGSLLILNLSTNTIEREVGKGLNRCPPVIDTEGNIYFSSIIEEYNNGNPALFYMTPDVKILWFFPHNQYTKSGSVIKFSYHSATLDNFGNYCFGLDTIYSVSPEGKLNWKYIPDAYVTSQVISDKNRDILLVKDYGDSFGLILLSPDGVPLFQSYQNSFSGTNTVYHGICVDNKLIIPTQDKYLYSLGGN